MKSEIVPLNSVQMADLLRLFEIVWPGRASNSEQLSWAFGENPLGAAPVVGAIDEVTAELTGVRGSIRWPLTDTRSRNRLTAVQYGGTCVHPSYRRTGLFTKMTEETVKRTREAGFDIIFNVSVPASRLGYEKLGWRYLAGFRGYHRVERFGHVASVFFNRARKREVQGGSVESLVSRSSSPQYADVQEFIERRDEVLGGLASTSYSASFFEWRFGRSYHRMAGSSTLGYLVYRMRSAGCLRDLLIGDLWPAPGRAFDLLAEAVEIERPDTTTIWMSNAHPLRRSLVRHGFVPDLRRSLNFGVKTLTPPAEVLAVPSSWAAVPADIDTF